MGSMGPMTFVDEVRYHGPTISLAHIFRPRDPNHERNSVHDIEHWKPQANMSCKRNRGYQMREAIQVRSMVFLWIWTRKSLVLLVPEQTKGCMGLHCQEMRQKFEEASHPIFEKHGVAVLHSSNTTSTMTRTFGQVLLKGPSG